MSTMINMFKLMLARAFVISFLLHAPGINFNFLQAQIPPNMYVGLEGMYGVRILSISSDIPEISEAQVIEHGASLGALIGNEFLRTKLRIANGDYTSMSYPRTVKLFHSEVQINFYPLEFIRTHCQLMDAYVLGGLSWDATKFYGHFHDQDNNRTPINYSNPHEPYLGKVTQWSASFGVGVEYHVLYVSSFLHVFAEIKCGSPLFQYSDNEYLSRTSMGTFSALTVGVSFGLHQQK